MRVQRVSQVTKSPPTTEEALTACVWLRNTVTRLLLFQLDAMHRRWVTGHYQLKSAIANGTSARERIIAAIVYYAPPPLNFVQGCDTIGPTIDRSCMTSLGTVQWSSLARLAAYLGFSKSLGRITVPRSRQFLDKVCLQLKMIFLRNRHLNRRTSPPTLVNWASRIAASSQHHLMESRSPPKTSQASNSLHVLT